MIRQFLGTRDMDSMFERDKFRKLSSDDHTSFRPTRLYPSIKQHTWAFIYSSRTVSKREKRSILYILIKPALSKRNKRKPLPFRNINI